MITTDQRKIIQHAKKLVKDLFAKHPTPAHGFDHAERTRKWAVEIAKAEKANVFLCELAALLHDIGRVPEHLGKADGKTHHELSYEMCREWFRNDPGFQPLSRTEKLIILYSLRYHSNDEASKYDVAWILRDADKLDGFGTIGLQRTLIFYAGDEDAIEKDLRLRFQWLANVKTKTAQQFIKHYELFRPIERYYKRRLRAKIKPVTL